MPRDADFPCPPAPLSLAFAYFFAQAAESLCEPFYPVSDPTAYAARNHATFGTLAGLHFVLGSGFVVCGLWTLVWGLGFEDLGLYLGIALQPFYNSEYAAPASLIALHLGTRWGLDYIKFGSKAPRNSKLPRTSHNNSDFSGIHPRVRLSESAASSDPNPPDPAPSPRPPARIRKKLLIFALCNFTSNILLASAWLFWMASNTNSSDVDGDGTNGPALDDLNRGIACASRPHFHNFKPYTRFTRSHYTHSYITSAPIPSLTQCPQLPMRLFGHFSRWNIVFFGCVVCVQRQIRGFVCARKTRESICEVAESAVPVDTR
jgi:hypothetical protein